MSLIEDKMLKAERLRNCCDPALLGFATTKSLSVFGGGLIGQERATSAVKFGLDVNSKGYNIFIVGEAGSGRTSYAVKELKRRAASMPAPDDWVYVNNFDEPDAPIAINLPAGQGKKLAKDAEAAVDDIKQALSKAFDNSEYEDNKAVLVKAFQDEVNKLMDDLRSWAEKKKFAVKRTPQGFINLPLFYAKPLKQDGTLDEEAEPVLREMQQNEFEELSSKEQAKLQKVSEAISQKTLETLRIIREYEKQLKERIRELESEICRTAIDPVMADFRAKYVPNKKLEHWFDEYTKDIVANFNMFLAAARDENAEVDFSRYSVNPFVCNDPQNGAPVIRETNPNYYNLVGKVEYESKLGNLNTDFRRITSGAIHRANGGYLLLDADELLRQFMSWDVLKRVLRCHELSIENLAEQLGYIPVSSLRPEPVPINIKVVVVGTPWFYSLLNYYDPEFKKVFKIRADFDTDMPRTKKTELELAEFVAGFVKREGKLNFSASAVAEIIEWASREAEDQHKLCTQLDKIANLLVESTAWARQAEKKRVGVEHVRKAISERKYRLGMIEEKIREEYGNGVIKIDTKGEAVGQINGLTVLTLIDSCFGTPVRITANVFTGQDGIVNIEREVDMTGPIHNKGLLILSSYLGKMYAQDFPLSIAARITFEQTYGGVEGDSASSTELYCLLSAISGLPLRQDIAVTGSVDQFGNIQPIGGVNEKIEGFYSYCKLNGLTGTQGVMIPYQNEQHLMLDHEVVDAVKKGKFHIWSVKTI
ncbi:MAG: ATP-binding protein, partial [Synergistaceae bacterium]|nr:ATP-binding protein [Synergistaceae bacterium]